MRKYIGGVKVNQMKIKISCPIFLGNRCELCCGNCYYMARCFQIWKDDSVIGFKCFVDKEQSEFCSVVYNYCEEHGVP
jgi:hypothetical protein